MRSLELPTPFPRSPVRIRINVRDTAPAVRMMGSQIHAGSTRSSTLAVSDKKPRRMRRMKDLRAIEDVRLPDSEGNEVRVGDLWRDQPLVLVWLRHYG